MIAALTKTKDRAAAVERARKLVERTEGAVRSSPDKDLLRSAVAEARLTLASAHRAVGEWDEARPAAEAAAALARTLVTGRRGDPNARLLRDAEAAAAECAAHAGGASR